MKKIIIEGSRFSDLPGFYDEIERVFTKNLGWKIGRNLDAFNDVLRGGLARLITRSQLAWSGKTPKKVKKIYSKILRLFWKSLKAINT